MKVSLFPYEEVEKLWPRVEPYMEGAAEYTYGRFTADDILDQILHYDHTLWAAYDEQCIRGATVTSIIHYPRTKSLAMVFEGGIDIKEWADPMVAVLRKWAKDNGCDDIECTGRPGWAKIFKNNGHKILWHTFNLPLDTGIGV